MEYLIAGRQAGLHRTVFPNSGQISEHVNSKVNVYDEAFVPSNGKTIGGINDQPEKTPRFQKSLF
jgi:hypothetical protein